MLHAAMGRLRELYLRVFETEIIRRIVANSGYLVSAQGVSAALGMVQSFFVVRMLGPAGFGLLGAVTQFTNTINRFTSFRINELVVRYVRLYEERSQSEKAAAVYKLAGLLELSGAAAAFLLVVWLAPLGSHIFAHDTTTAKWFMLYGVVALTNLVYDSSTGLLQVFDRFRTLAVITAIQGVAILGLILYAFLRAGGFFEVLLAYVVGKLIGAIGVTAAAWIAARSQWGRGWWRSPLRSLSEDRHSLLTFAFSTNVSSTISLVAKDSESLWVSAFLGTTQAGYYKLALSLISILQLPVSPLPSTTYPELAREIARKAWDNVRYILRRGSALAATYSLPIMVLLIVFGRPLIALYAGEEFLPAYGPLVILLLGYTVTNILYWNRVALLALNRPVFPTVVNLLGMTLKVAGIFLLATQFEALAFAGLLSGYYIFTVGVAAARVLADLRGKQAIEAGA